MTQLKDQMYTMRDLVDLAKTTRPTIYRWIRLQDFPKPIKVGRKLLWRREEIDKYLDSRK